MKISQAYAVTEEQYKLFMDQLDYVNAEFPEAYLMYSVNDDLASHTKALDEVLNKVGVAHITKAYGQNNPDSGHIFHECYPIKTDKGKDRKEYLSHCYFRE